MVVKYYANCKSALTKWGSTLAEWEQWPAEDRTEALSLMPAAVQVWPEEVRAAVLESLTGEGGSK